ncbi:MAG: autotransporter outer membrane beta-barrel domain-containing protein [Verrucomicrobiales bacterium]|jgi:outer membrane autotransporter protein|nr:autotransporter outer membrane beta-barrel domain-containing protein [Verrucomicrobiales bacterium]
MKTPNMQRQLKTLTLILTLLPALTLTVAAQSLVVDGTAYPAESGMTYSATSGTMPAILVTGTGGSYTGTDITLSSTFANNRTGAFWIINGGTAALFSSTIHVSNNRDVQGSAIRVSNASGHFENVVINTGLGNDYIITAQGTTAYLVLNAVTVNNNDGGDGGFGLIARDHATVIATDLAITLTGTGRAIAVSSGENCYIEVTRGDINVNGSQPAYDGNGVNRNQAVCAWAGGTLVLNDSRIRSTSGGGATEPNATLILNNTLLETTGTAALIDSMSDSIIIVNGGTMRSSGGDLVQIHHGGTNTLLFANTDLTQVGGIATGTSFTGTADITIAGGSGLHGNITNSGAGTLTLALHDSSITGNTISGSASTTTLNLDHSTVAGNVNAGEDAVLIITGNNGATISGDVTGSEHAVIDLTLSGSASSLTGDITRNDTASVTVTLDHDATGSGGFTGGHLIIGGDSVWIFDKNSTTDRIDNHGVVRVGAPGNYLAIHSDNLSGDGAWLFPVDSDTGVKSTVSGSTAVTSHPRGIISVIGDGLRDPNTVVNTLVTGENKENWIWDNFTWGLEEYTQDGHDSDGNPHFTQHSTSPIGAVLGSAIAVQQSLWFAQQDSLLKRMGELRYGTRASRPPAGGTPALHIENIWLRSYGQQLNIGSQVAGQAYEQLIYGIDLGTDHKFTLSADSDLYLGVYAGYGCSDIDYRTPGADGEINSYYGGFYATWLHSSGFYIDATFKAASVNNDLTAPYGTTQLIASYSDVNIGGSLEIGNKFTFTDGWFVEPQFQVNYLHILAENYTAGPMTLSAQDLDALQLRLGSLFGRTIKLTNSGALQPYVKISGVETISSGGTLHNGYQHTRANTDGARAELGGGLIWQLDAANQLHLDYEASFGDKYDKPWGLTAGYRHQF